MFTQDLAKSIGEREVAVLLPPGRGVPYPLEVHHRIRRDERADYGQAARAVGGCVDVVSIQHEFGIWGGDDGEYVLDFVRALHVPAVVTLHTVLRAPTPHQRAIVTELIASAVATVVMSRSAARLAARTYGADPGRVEVIPYGVPDLPLADPATVRAALGVEGRQVILSFGLLGPHKGYELALDALPAVVATHPKATYVIVGVTHPDLLDREGEAYRERLVARVKSLGMTDHVRFVDRFVDRVELTRWLQAADVFAAPCPDPDRSVSGSLPLAMGAGKAIVSTTFAFAAELLAGGRGVLVPQGSPSAFASAINDLLDDDRTRAAIGRRAHKYSRPMVWSEVGAAYRRLFAGVAAGTPTATVVSSRTALNA